MRALLLVLFSFVTLTALPGVAGAMTHADGDPGGRVALFGIPSLTWDDIDERNTPNLWRLARDGSAGALSVRALGTVACPIDGWLTVSAGARSSRPSGPCDALPPVPVPAGESASVTEFPGMRTSNVESRFRSPVGLLGETVRKAGGCTTAVGPGAALALADARGRVDIWAPSAGQVTGPQLARCAVIAVDVDEVLRSGRSAAALHRADAAVGQVLAALPAGTTVLVSGISDGPSAAGPHLRVAIAAGPGTRAASYLSSDSTRREAIVITPDVTATVLRAARLPLPAEMIGTPWRGVGHRAEGAPGITDLTKHDVAAQTYKTVLPRFFLGLVISQVVFYLLAALMLRKRRSDDGTARPQVLRVVRLIALACAAVPVSTYLVNLVPWWQLGAPKAALLGGIAAFDALIVAVALTGPWRRALLGPGTVVAAATALTVGADLLTGTELQQYSLMGYSPLVGGRYYGLGNIAFSVFATSVLLTSAGLAQWLVQGSGRSEVQARRAAVAVVVVLGTLAMALDGLPMWGADFGGVVAIVPGLAVATLMVAEKRISLVRLALFCGIGGALVLLIAFLDHLGGSSTHLGRFFGELLEGEAGPTVERKFSAMVKTMRNPTLTPIAAAALVLLYLMLRRPGKLGVGALERAFAQAPLLRAGLMGALATAVVGTLVNDSGMAVLALALVVAVPLALVAALQPAAPTTPALDREPEPQSSAGLG